MEYIELKILLLKSKMDVLDCLRDNEEITSQVYSGYSISCKDVFINDVWDYIEARKKKDIGKPIAKG